MSGQCPFAFTPEVTVGVCLVMKSLASEASETLSRVTNGNRRYKYIYMVRARHFSSADPVLRNVGGVKCQPFLYVTIGNKH